MPRSELLSFEEINRIASIFVNFGVRKIRITGGEPLLRKDIDNLIQRLARLPQVDLTMTTNGALLSEMANALKKAGLNRITVSLDSLDDDVFAQMNDVEFPVKRVLDGIEAAHEAGLSPIKVNMVVKRGLNEDSILPMARYFRGTDHVLRFIEFMDVGSTNGWHLDDVVYSTEILKLVESEFPLEPLDPNYLGEVARRYRYKDGAGEIGFISSVTQPFCNQCTRARLSADGKLYTCLFAAQGSDLRSVLRSESTDEELEEIIKGVWTKRTDRYSEIRSSETTDIHKIEMSYIGG